MDRDLRVSSLEELREHVDNHDGVLTTTMGVLRDAYGKGRLGPHVRAGIHNALAGLGLGHFPSELPEYQNERVRLYRLGSPVGNLINAVLDLSEESDELLRGTAGSQDTEILRQIKELVCM